MQRNENGGVVISCDFCGTDWDEVMAMIEGHHGSVLCLSCLKTALEQASASGEKFSCTMCLHEFPGDQPHWAPNTRPPAANPAATICDGCINQAAGTFSKDPDVDWKRPQQR